MFPFRKAAQWRRKAEQGDPEAMAQLAWCYVMGIDGVAEDRAQAATWYRKAIAAGSTTGDSENMLGDLYMNGHGVPKSLPEAFKWFRAGAAKGNQYAKNGLDRLKRQNPNEWPNWERECLAAEQREKDPRAAEKAEQERRAAEQQERERVAAQRITTVQPNEWLVDDLAAWLERVGLTSLVPVFRQQEIDGESLAEVTEDRLEKMGVSAFGLRTKFLKQRDQLLATTVPANPAPRSTTPATPFTTADASDTVLSLRPVDRDEFEVGKILGHGSFGAVYKGTYRHSQVAIKLALPELSTEQQAELRTEAETMQRIPGHPNVVQFFGACFDDEGAAILSELCEAGPLYKYLKNKPSLSVAVRVTLCSEIAAGMSHLERQRIVHRDLAARNVLLQPRGVNRDGEPVVVAKVADFGLSRQLKDSKKDHYTIARSTVAFRWAAPEVLLTRQHSSASDVWSFGVVVWEVFSPGQTPHDAVPDVAAMQARMQAQQGALPRPSMCPDDVWAVAAPCFAFEPSSRPTFSALHASFAKLLSKPAYAPV